MTALDWSGCIDVESVPGVIVGVVLAEDGWPG